VNCEDDDVNYEMLRETRVLEDIGIADVHEVGIWMEIPRIERDSLYGLRFEDDGSNHSVVLVKNRITLFICNEPLTSRYRNRCKG